LTPLEAPLYLKGYATWSRYLWDHDNERPAETKAECSNYGAWRETWRIRGIQSPLELIAGARPNFTSIGIECQSPMERLPQVFTDAQYESLSELLGDIWFRHKVPLARDRVLTHSDCSPLRRSNAHGPNDPGPGFNWARLWNRLYERPGLRIA
jgi:hypothetical protein